LDKCRFKFILILIARNAMDLEKARKENLAELAIRPQGFAKSVLEQKLIQRKTNLVQSVPAVV